MTKQLLEQAVALAKDVLDSLEDWAGYAPTYFKGKHGYSVQVLQYNQRIKALEAAIASWSDEPAANGCQCVVCGEWQRWTPSGMTCKNGHGGAQGINTKLYTRPAPSEVTAAQQCLERAKNVT